MTIDEITELANQIAEARRRTVRPLLGKITAELEREMLAAGLDFPVSVSTASAGTAIVTLMTPDEPPQAQFDKTADILCAIVRRYLGGAAIDHRAVSCAASTPVAGEITAGD